MAELTPQELEEIKARHQERVTHYAWGDGRTCEDCNMDWPCEQAILAARIEELEKGLRAILEEHQEIAKAGPYGSECCTCSPQDGNWPCVTVLEARAALGGEDG